MLVATLIDSAKDAVELIVEKDWRLPSRSVIFPL
jgi:hypothetical protein